MNQSSRTENPLQNLEEWEDDLHRRYPEPAGSEVSPSFRATDPEKQEQQFRDHRAEARASVKEFYRLNHTFQTVDFGRQKRAQYLSLQMRRMGIWEALEFLNTLVDDSDPDTDLAQIEHCLQTSEAIRRDQQPDWFILTGLIHDLGKILCLYGEPQWAVVGDTFPVGCRFSDKIVFPEFFAENPDLRVPEFQTRTGIYVENAGLDGVLMSWGHDEYLYHVVKEFLPTPALYMIRYHSFYPAHREGEYQHLMTQEDIAMFEWVKKFNRYDLYTKSHERPDVGALKPFYEELIEKYFPPQLAW